MYIMGMDYSERVSKEMPYLEVREGLTQQLRS